jgi:hypothetical protein
LNATNKGKTRNSNEGMKSNRSSTTEDNEHAKDNNGGLIRNGLPQSLTRIAACSAVRQNPALPISRVLGNIVHQIPSWDTIHRPIRCGPEESAPFPTAEVVPPEGVDLQNEKVVG